MVGEAEDAAAAVGDEPAGGGEQAESQVPGVPHAVSVRESQLGAGAGPFLPDDQPRVLGAFVQDVAWILRTWVDGLGVHPAD